MPELPEIETLARELRKKSTGLILSRCRLRHQEIVKHPESFNPSLIQRRRVLDVGRAGKFLYFEFEDANRLWFHLGMTGQLLWNSNDQEPGVHDHVLLDFEKCPDALWFRDIRKFGRAFITASAGTPAAIAGLGPDALLIKPENFLSIFKNRTGHIKNLLLNQRLVAGLGNIYANESLYRARIHPRRRPHRLPARSIEKLYGVIQEILEEAIACGGSSIDDYRHSDGSRGSFQKRHQVYGRGGEACFGCSQKIQRIELSGRSSFFCPNCQK